MDWDSPPPDPQQERKDIIGKMEKLYPKGGKVRIYYATKTLVPITFNRAKRCIVGQIMYVEPIYLKQAN